MQTPEQIAANVMDDHLDPEGAGEYGPDIETTAEAISAMIIAAIEADRAQRPEVPFDTLDTMLADWEDYDGDVSAFIQDWADKLTEITKG